MSYDVTTGQLASITAPGGENLAYTYLGELLTLESWSGPVAGSVGYSYDNDFRVASQTVNGANTVTFSYDGDSLLTQAGALTLDYAVDNGLLEGTTLDTVTDAFTYNLFAEVTAYEASDGGGAFYSTSYVRDDIGRITEKTETLNGTTTVYAYTYDTAGRLTAVTTNSAPSAVYTYDSNGNRLSGPGVETGTCDAQDRMLTYGGNSYTYSANGELTSKTAGTDVTTYSYDELGNLESVGLPDGTAIDYVIDGLQRRVGKRVDGTLEQGFLYDGSLAIVAELDGSGALVSRFVYAGGANVPAYVVQGGVTYRIITDHLGSLRLVVRASDSHVVQRMNHDEFGRVTEDFVDAGFTRVPFGFAGGLYDPDTGLVRFGARDYDAESGRWTAKDPIGFTGGDANLYGYGTGDPINLTDVTGETPGMGRALVEFLGNVERMAALDVWKKLGVTRFHLKSLIAPWCGGFKNLLLYYRTLDPQRFGLLHQAYVTTYTVAASRIALTEGSAAVATTAATRRLSAWAVARFISGRILGPVGWALNVYTVYTIFRDGPPPPAPPSDVAAECGCVSDTQFFLNYGTGP